MIGCTLLNTKCTKYNRRFTLKGRNINIHFKEDELNLLEDFTSFCKENYSSKSGELKRHIRTLVKEKKTLVAH